MAHKLGLKVIAEGVESAAQRDLLAAAGCDYVQVIGVLSNAANSGNKFVINLNTLNGTSAGSAAKQETSANSRAQMRRATGRPAVQRIGSELLICGARGLILSEP